ISHLGAMIPVLVGKLLAKRMKGEKGFVGLTTIGEGGMQTGATHEGMNIAAVEHVPLVIVATNNHYAYSTANDREFACADLVDREAVDQMRAEIAAEIDEAVATAQQEDAPHGSEEEWRAISTRELVDRPSFVE